MRIVKKPSRKNRRKKLKSKKENKKKGMKIVKKTNPIRIK